MSSPPAKDPEVKKDLLRKYATGLAEIWKTLIDEGPETGDPLLLFDSAVKLTETSLARILAD